MSEWQRSTRACSPGELPADMAAAVNHHMAACNLGSLLEGILAGMITTSEKKKKGLFGGALETVTLAAFVVPGWLVWVVKDKSGCTALSARLADVAITEYKNTPAFRLIPDNGLEVTGTITGRLGAEDRAQGNAAVSVFIGLGSEPSAVSFQNVLLTNWQSARA